VNEHESMVKEGQLSLKDKIKEVITFYQQELDFGKMIYSR